VGAPRRGRIEHAGAFGGPSGMERGAARGECGGVLRVRRVWRGAARAASVEGCRACGECGGVLRVRRVWGER
jgi:hypothetical protein